jgi:hypothetical protein
MIEYRYLASEQTDSAILGWRAWRVLPWRELDGAPSYRLAACGTKGIPKVWRPQLAAEAVCSEYETLHEAPWPQCDCGIHAYKDRVEAEQHWQRFIGFKPEEVAGWAFGRVSMWGQVIECERGWRAQYAYPWTIDVHATPEVAAAIRNLYLIDVNARDPVATDEPTPTTGDLRARVATLAAEAQELEEELTRAAAADVRTRKAWKSEYRYVQQHSLTNEQGVAGVTAALERTGFDFVSSKEVAFELADGEYDQPLSESAATATGIVLRRAAFAGDVIRLQRIGRNGPYGSCHWTLPGREDNPDIAAEGLKPVPDYDWERRDRDVLNALQAAVKKAKGEPVRINAVIAELEEPEEKSLVSFKSQVAQALIRCEYRLRVTADGQPKRYALV